MLSSAVKNKARLGYCEIVESKLAVFAKLSWSFHSSLSVCSAIAGNRQYIIEIWPVLMACTCKNRVLLAAFKDKISIFHLGQTEHRSARGDGSLFAQHRALISYTWSRATSRKKMNLLTWRLQTRLDHKNPHDVHPLLLGRPLRFSAVHEPCR